MPIQIKNIGRIPVYFGDYVSGRLYQEKHRVTLYGSEFQAAKDNPSKAPLTYDASTHQITSWNVVNGEHASSTGEWYIISNGTDAWIASDKMDDILLRMQGISENYDGDMDPVLRKRFPKDTPDGMDEYKYSIKQANDFLNEEYVAIKDDKFYRGQENGAPKEIDYQEFSSICRNIVHIDISGACVWVMNMPYTYATGSFRQIAFGVSPYSSTESGYDVTNGINAGSQVLQRLSSYDWNTGEVTWSDWTEIISDLDAIRTYLNSIRTTVSGALQRSGGKMTGNINLNNHAIFVQEDRRGIQFAGNGNYQGVYVGNGNMRLFLETNPNLNVVHKKGNNYYTLFDEGNTVYDVIDSSVFNGVIGSQITVSSDLANVVNSGHTPIYLSCNGILSHCDVFTDGTKKGLIWHINAGSEYVVVKGEIQNTTLTIIGKKVLFNWNT